MSTLIEKMTKASKIKNSGVLADSKFFNVKDSIKTDLPILNIAFSGSLNGGLSTGLTIIAGQSKSFKTLLGLFCVKAYLDSDPEAICLFYDSEFGVTPNYLKSNGIDTSRVIHIPIENVETLKFDLVSRLNQIERNDKAVIFVDSLGALASKKEVEDAVEEKSVADMSRAKAIRSLLRIITPLLTLKDIPAVMINHVYSEMCLAGDVEIKTITGNKKIQDIIVGDFVYALNGTQKVLHVYKPEDLDGEDKRFYELTFDDGSTVKCTHDHKFLDENKQWKKAEDFKLGDNFY